MARKSNKINLTCENCSITYLMPPSKASKSKFCSRVCKDQFNTIHNTVANCLSCNDEFVVKQQKKYCSRDCYITKNKKKRITLTCECCNETYEKPFDEITKYCSKSCQFTAQSSGLAEIPSNGRAGFRKDLPNNYFFKSSLEADYARWCESTNKPYVYEHKTFSVQYGSRTKMYTPDFYHPDEDRYVELKAIRRDRKFNSNLLATDILKSNGLNIDVLLMHEFYTKIKQSGHYWLIENMENKNYLGTKHLIYLKKKVV